MKKLCGVFMGLSLIPSTFALSAHAGEIDCELNYSVIVPGSYDGQPEIVVASGSDARQELTEDGRSFSPITATVNLYSYSVSVDARGMIQAMITQRQTGAKTSRTMDFNEFVKRAASPSSVSLVVSDGAEDVLKGEEVESATLVCALYP